MPLSGASSQLSALIILTAVFYLNFFSRIIFSPLLPSIEQNLSISHGTAGSFFLILSCGYFTSLVGSGYISSNLSHKKTIIFSMFAISASLFLIASVTTLIYLQSAFFILGMAAGIYLPSGISTISALFSQNQWGRAFAVHELAPNLAFLTAPLFSSLFVSHLHWQQIIIILAIASFLSALFYIRFGRGENLFGEPPSLANSRAILFQKNFILLTLLFSMGITGTIGVFNVLPLFLVTSHFITLQDANLMVGLSRIATLFSALAGGWLADRFGNRRTICGVLLTTGISTVCIGLTHGISMIIWIYLQPVLAVCFFPAGFALLSRLGTPETRNIVISLAVPLAFVLGGGLLPALVAGMADAGFFHTGLILMGIFISSGSVFIFFLQYKGVNENTACE
ncbi:MAG: MFS transporter [Desulfobulbaceae bacterium]|nr:MFS transporter [Desulfobulbaceae bacterium]